MQDYLVVSIDLELCLPRAYKDEQDAIRDLKDIKSNIYEFIYAHKDEFEIKTLFKLKDSQE